MIRQEKTFKKIVDANEKRKKRKNTEVVKDIKNFVAEKNAKIMAGKILKKYKSMKRPKKTYIVNEEDIKTIDYNELPDDLLEGESILKAANKVLDFEAFKKEQKTAMIENNLKKKNSKNSAKIAAKKISNKYRNLKKPKKTFLVDKKDLETIVHDEPEDLFKGESILAAANKLIDFNEFEKQQANAIEKFNENLLENAETINYVDDINLDDVQDKKDLIITSKKISDKYRKFRKRKAADREKQIKETIDSFMLMTKKEKRQIDKLANGAAKNISKKYKNIKIR